MRLPNKVTTYEESILPAFLKILERLKDDELSPAQLYAIYASRMSVSEFVEALDCLYALGKVDFSKDARRLRYVDGD